MCYVSNHHALSCIHYIQFYDVIYFVCLGQSSFHIISTVSIYIPTHTTPWMAICQPVQIITPPLIFSCSFSVSPHIFLTHISFPVLLYNLTKHPRQLNDTICLFKPHMYIRLYYFSFYANGKKMMPLLFITMAKEPSHITIRCSSSSTACVVYKTVILYTNTNTIYSYIQYKQTEFISVRFSVI